ncbi:hypothetical protein ACOJBO_00105 [Rhizobium beringeri]
MVNFDPRYLGHGVGFSPHALPICAFAGKTGFQADIDIVSFVGILAG